MPRGFVYVVATVTRSFEQPSLSCVPTALGDRIYFGPCKKPMRPRVNVGDYVFGMSPARTSPRRLVFVMFVAEVITFAEAYRRFPELRGPVGPVHVRPVARAETFPRSEYEHIAGSTHPDDWEADLATRSLDRFLVSHPVSGWLNRWLGADGPEVDTEVLAVLNSCPVYGRAGGLASRNGGTLSRPIAYGGLTTGLHVEIPEAESLLEIVARRLAGAQLPHATVTEPPAQASGSCRPRRRVRYGPRRPNCR